MTGSADRTNGNDVVAMVRASELVVAQLDDGPVGGHHPDPT
jgi:hypothetical protein